MDDTRTYLWLGYAVARIDKHRRTPLASRNEQGAPVTKADKKRNRIQEQNLQGQFNATGHSRELPKDAQNHAGSNQTNVRLGNLTYKASAKHHAGVRGDFISAAPTNGQAALDASTQIKSTSPRRIAVDTDAQEFVVFDQTVVGEFHGHVRTWEQLSDQMKSLLRKQGLVNKKGRIQGASRCDTNSPSPSLLKMPSLLWAAMTSTWSAAPWCASFTARWSRSGFRAAVLKRHEASTLRFAARPLPAWATSPAFTAA